VRYARVAFLATLASCSRSGSIEGDVFEANAGVVTRGAGVPMYIFTAPDSARSAIRSACADYDAGSHRLRVKADSELLDSHDITKWPKVHERRLLEQAFEDSLKYALYLKVSIQLRHQRQMYADINGHFHVDSLAPGPVMLLAVDSKMTLWMDTVRVTAGANVRHDLQTPIEGEMICWDPLVAKPVVTRN
jgi:hypothetical protein